jgi:5-methylcytosine-specific restriction endonuclease McrA
MVFVIDKHKQPLMPCSEKRARLLLQRGRAVIHRRFPFVIRLKDRRVADSQLQPLRLKTDPGSKASGIAIVRETEETDRVTGEVKRTATVVHLAEIHHRGEVIHQSMLQLKMLRRNRRTRHLRHRAPRFNNRCRRKGWLAPSLQSRVDNLAAWTGRYRRWCPIERLSQELVRFDMQKMKNPDIEGVEYQHGTLEGYEVKGYLLEKWEYRCAYCGATDVPLQVEHIKPRSRGGSDRVSNLTVACVDCNRKKGNRTAEEFGHPEVEDQARKSLKDAAAVNSTRWAVKHMLEATGLPVETGTGARTKWNRKLFGVPKTHALDALCVGRLEEVQLWEGQPVFEIHAMGPGSYQRTLIDRWGWPRGYLIRTKRVHGFQTGDMVRAKVPKGKRKGTHVGRVMVRASGSFDIQTISGRQPGIGWKHCVLLARRDGYGYYTRKEAALLPTTEVEGVRAEAVR